MSAVTDTSEQRLGLTQCADDFLPTFKALETSKTLPPACLFEPEQEDRCSRKTHTKPKAVNLWSRYSSSASHFWKPSSCFQHAFWSERKFKDMFFSITIVTHVFPRWSSRDPDARQSQGSVQGLSDPPPPRLHPIQQPSVTGSLFSNDLPTDKWCVTNFIIMQLVFPEKWSPAFLYSWKVNECCAKNDWHLHGLMEVQLSKLESTFSITAHILMCDQIL